MNQDPNICKSRNQQLLVIPEMDQIQLDLVLIPPSKTFVAIEFCLNKNWNNNRDGIWKFWLIIQS